jgi:hypothetical protein
MDRLAIFGAVDGVSQAVSLAPIYMVPESEEFPGHRTGDYTVVLRNGQGNELLRYPFALGEASHLEASNSREQRAGLDSDDPGAQLTAPRTIAELVPVVAGVDQIDIEGPGGVLLHRVQAGSQPPVVQVDAPIGGIRIPPNQESLEVRWSASDADGDPLTYRVEYSPDGGKRWRLFSMGISETVVAIPAENLIASPSALVRVSASDGVHTSMDTPDAEFAVLNHPPTVTILPIADPVAPAQLVARAVATDAIPVYAVGQTVTFQAEGYDIEKGSLDQELTWSSNIDGALGAGGLLGLSTLSPGTHTISVMADDGEGGLATAQTLVRIVGELEELPPVPNDLLVSPGFVYFANTETVTQTIISLSNLNPNNSIQWQATANQPWVQLSAASGDTDGELIVSLAPEAALPDGTHEATLTLTSPQLPGQPIKLPVIAEVLLESVYLPLVVR